MINLLKTSLFKKHAISNANMQPFGNYLMPISYSGIIDEYSAVRNNVGIFDVSHMGEFLISGKKADEFLQYLTVNDISKLKNGKVQYSAMCYEDGGVVDDILIYKNNQNDFMLVVNASNINKNYEWIKSRIISDVELKDISKRISLIALQGPKSTKLLSEISKDNISNLKYYAFLNDCNIADKKCTVSRTGYTGELGYEIYADNDDISIIWDELMSRGIAYDILPAGLGCRDVLRLEMGYALYGNDISDKFNPLESGLSWITKTNKNNFIGKDSIIDKNFKRKQIAFEMIDRSIPRSGFPIEFENTKIGKVTSGTMSPILKKGIGLGIIDKISLKESDVININIRGKMKSAEIVELPFYKKGSLKF